MLIVQFNFYYITLYTKNQEQTIILCSAPRWLLKNDFNPYNSESLSEAAFRFFLDSLIDCEMTSSNAGRFSFRRWSCCTASWMLQAVILSSVRKQM